jgi:hypothetical protein
VRIASFVEISWNRYVGSVAAAEVRMTSRLETEIRLEERIAGGIVLWVLIGEGDGVEIWTRFRFERPGLINYEFFFPVVRFTRK